MLSTSTDSSLAPLLNRPYAGPMVRLTLLALIAAALVTAGNATATAATPKLTTSQAQRAIEREVKAVYDATNMDFTCKRLSRTRIKCRFIGFAFKGTAYARRYSRGIDARVSSFRECPTVCVSRER